MGSHTYITKTVTTTQTWQPPVDSSAVSIFPESRCSIMQLHRGWTMEYFRSYTVSQLTKTMVANRDWAYGSCHVKGNIRKNSARIVRRCTFGPAIIVALRRFNREYLSVAHWLERCNRTVAEQCHGSTYSVAGSRSESIRCHVCNDDQLPQTCDSLEFVAVTLFIWQKTAQRQMVDSDIYLFFMLAIALRSSSGGKRNWVVMSCSLLSMLNWILTFCVAVSLTQSERNV